MRVESCVFVYRGFPYIVHVYLVRVQQKVLHLPDTELVGEVQHRTECSSGGQEHGSEGHFLGEGERAVAVGACVAIYHSLAFTPEYKHRTWNPNLPLSEMYSWGKYMPKVKPVKAPR